MVSIVLNPFRLDSLYDPDKDKNSKTGLKSVEESDFHLDF
jgi:hypothetical protein